MAAETITLSDDDDDDSAIQVTGGVQRWENVNLLCADQMSLLQDLSKRTESVHCALSCVRPGQWINHVNDPSTALLWTRELLMLSTYTLILKENCTSEKYQNNCRGSY